MGLGWQASVSESTATNSRIPWVSGWLFQPGCFVRNDGINECYATFPAVSSNSYVVINYALNMQFTPFCKRGLVSRTCGKVLTS